MTMTQEPTIEAPQAMAEGDYRETQFDIRFIDVQLDTLHVALRDYLKRRGETAAAQAVETMYELAVYVVERSVNPRGEFSSDLASNALAKMSQLVQLLDGRLYAPSGVY